MVHILKLAPFAARAIALMPLFAFNFVFAADLPRFSFPIDSGVDSFCSIQNFFDHDPGPGFRDYACGFLGYDGHDGTDIRVPNLAVMREGVAVVAAASGKVRAIRDKMPDVSVRQLGRESVRGREAGNAVVLRHGSDWETQYSHLRKGSVRVQPGDDVKAGQILGQIGLSGKTEFPHLHFEVRYRGEPVDPFVGIGGGAACNAGPGALWNAALLQQLQYQPTGVLQAGFSAREPRLESVLAGDASDSALQRDIPALVFWVEVFGAQKGDRESIRLIGPDGKVISRKTATIKGNKARWLSYAGRKKRGTHWPEGVYRATYELLREDAGGENAVIALERTIELK